MAILGSVSLALLELHPVRGRERRLEDGDVIGRAVGCELVLDDPLISRRHARVLSSRVGAAIEDLGSANGLCVNGLAVGGVSPLHPGDVIQLGATCGALSSSAKGSLVINGGLAGRYVKGVRRRWPNTL
jgi:pSer/pThr/pTyr-binding forkhead associated (FHA) protein